MATMKNLGRHTSLNIMTLAYWSLFLLMATSQSCSGAKFLLPSVRLFRTPSHHIVLTTITQALVQRGHEVTLLIIDNLDVGGILPDSYTSEMILPNPMTDEVLKEIYHARNSINELVNMTKLEIIRDPRIGILRNMEMFGCHELFKNLEILEQLQQEHFDKLISFPVADVCDAVLAAYLEIPYIVVTGNRRVLSFHEGMLGIPTPISYVPYSLFTPELMGGDSITFFDRLKNAAMFYGVHSIMEYFIIYRPIGQLQSTYGIRPDLTPWQMISRAELWLCDNTWAIEYPRPIAPNWIPIGGFTIKEPKPLPDDLEAFVQGSGEHGFIVFTLGSSQSAFGSDAINDIFSKVFSELPQRVIWRYIGPTPRYLGNNTLISDWLPQNDLLAHPKARLLIYHAGSAGVHEAITYGVPILLFPMGRDQPLNAHLVAKKGMGLILDSNNIHEDVIRTSISILLHEESFKLNAMKASGILGDRLAKPLDTAIFWIEHVVKYGGDHLRLRSTEMGFIQLNSLDVVAFLVVLSLIILYIDYIVIRACYRCICRKARKQKRD